MISQDIRRRFLNYFKVNSHRVVPSSPVVPHDDPNLLFTNAGMNQFKDIFLGKSKRDFKKACSSQKCIRVGGKHNDLENVGHTSRHLTFFEMLGNFSFGDYFKKEAIAFAWDLSTNVLQFDPEKIWVSVFKDDDEAFNLWEKHLPSSRIVRFDEKENFWSMGEIGPCGPCSELLYDRGPSYSDAPSPLQDHYGERYLEFWNLVFMEFNKLEDGSLKPLPHKNVDTGAGLERLASIKLNVESVFETDIFQTIISKISFLSNVKYDKENKEIAPAFHVISDHLRSLSFAIADGAIPSNTDRGYVLRKILRRAVRYGKKLNFQKPFLAEILPALIDTMGEDYKELVNSQKRIEEILTLEEENFFKTLKQGGNILNNIISKSKTKISGSDAFKLKDTYGFPIEEILLIAKDALLEVDIKSFNKLEEEAKEKSKKAIKVKSEVFHENIFADFTKVHSPSKFIGYDKNSSDSKVIALLKENKFIDKLEENERGIIILDKTPFYAEMGGQIGDSGKIYFGENFFEVFNTKTPYPGVIIHIGILRKGVLQKNQKVHAEIDLQKRTSICNNHSATHLLHFAMSKVLGEHITQSGSLVSDKYFRFDFTHHKALSYEEIKEIETIVNDLIRKNTKVKSYILPFEEARKDISIKQIFGEKYQKDVRVIDMEISKELCGGCHTTYLGNIGFFKIRKEFSIAAGIRRIEGVTGKEAEKFFYEKQEFIMTLENILNTKELKIFERLETLLKDQKKLLKETKDFKKEKIKNLKKLLLEKKEKIDEISLIAEEIDLQPYELTPFANELSSNLKSFIITLAIKTEKGCHILIKVSEDIIENKKLLANDLIKKIAPIIKGKGGGRMDLAQAGGADSTKIKEALKTLRSIVKEKC
jgi:alanyl-tRNA synthetase